MSNPYRPGSHVVRYPNQNDHRFSERGTLAREFAPGTGMPQQPEYDPAGPLRLGSSFELVALGIMAITLIPYGRPTPNGPA
jgi:hypothetical protein